MSTLFEMGNRVTGKHSAVINGKPTGLAGCASCGECARAPFCLRADPQLEHRITHRADGRCLSFIANSKATTS